MNENPTIRKALRKYPLPDPLHWIPEAVRDKVRSYSIANIKDNEMEDLFHSGRFPAGWLEFPVWPEIYDHAQEHEQSRVRTVAAIDKKRKKIQSLSAREAKLTAKKLTIEQQIEALQKEQAMLEDAIHSRTEMLKFKENVSEFIAVAARAVDMERDLVTALEEELDSENPQLSALNAENSTHPKLSLMMNCMGVDSQGIALTAQMDMVALGKATKNQEQFLQNDGLRKLSGQTIKDILYCGEMCRYTRILDHLDECAVCLNRTPSELVNFLHEKRLSLTHKEVLRKQINGPRVLFSFPTEFPRQLEEDVIQDLVTLRSIHESRLYQSPS